jgi:hypothetical protein
MQAKSDASPSEVSRSTLRVPAQKAGPSQPSPGQDREVLDAETQASTGTRSRLIRRVVKAVRPPTGRFKARKGQRNLPGRWWSATDARHVGSESWLERDQVMWLDWDQAVTGIASQSFRLRWTAEQGETGSHVPEYFAERAGGPALVVDCRPEDRRGPRDLAAFEVTRRRSGPSRARRSSS